MKHQKWSYPTFVVVGTITMEEALKCNYGDQSMVKTTLLFLQCYSLHCHWYMYTFQVANSPVPKLHEGPGIKQLVHRRVHLCVGEHICVRVSVHNVLRFRGYGIWPVPLYHSRWRYSCTCWPKSWSSCTTFGQQCEEQSSFIFTVKFSN